MPSPSEPRPDAGRVEVICGCMFAGKTALLIDRLRAAREAGRRVLAVKHASDRRYGAATLATHDGRAFEAHSFSDASRILVAAQEAQVLGIDEAQFFGDALVSVVLALRGRGVRVVLAGIDHNAWGLPFEPMPQLKRISDAVDVLTIPCGLCGAAARFTQRVTPIVGGDMIGGPADYSPRCGACFKPVSQSAPPG